MIAGSRSASFRGKSGSKRTIGYYWFAEIIGTWGCPPDKYPGVLQLCVDGKIQLGPFVETRPMSQIAEVFEQAHHGELKRRVILTPDF